MNLNKRIQIKLCPNCESPTEIHKNTCVNCNYAFNTEGIREQQSAKCTGCIVLFLVLVSHIGCFRNFKDIESSNIQRQYSETENRSSIVEDRISAPNWIHDIRYDNHNQNRWTLPDKGTILELDRSYGSIISLDPGSSKNIYFARGMHTNEFRAFSTRDLEEAKRWVEQLTPQTEYEYLKQGKLILGR